MTRSPVAFFMYAAIFAFWVAIWWQIFKKAGYSGLLSLLMLIPLVNLVMLIFLAVADWPVHRELRH